MFMRHTSHLLRYQSYQNFPEHGTLPADCRERSTEQMFVQASHVTLALVTIKVTGAFQNVGRSLQAVPDQAYITPRARGPRGEASQHVMGLLV